MLRYASEIDENNERRITCSECQFEIVTAWPLNKVYHGCAASIASRILDCSAPAPPGRVGSAMVEIIAELKMPEPPGCGCKAFAAQMDRWGVDGCREHRAEIVAHLQTAYAGLTWAEVSKAAAGAVTSGLVLRLNPLDLCGSLVDEAIRRADAISANP